MSEELNRKSELDLPKEEDDKFIFAYEIGHSGIDCLIGSEILQFGTIKNSRTSLGIEYKTKSGIIKRVIFEFDETGIFIEKQS